MHKLCEEIFEEQLAGRYRDTSTWPGNRSYEVFCHLSDDFVDLFLYEVSLRVQADGPQAGAGARSV